MEMLRLDEGRMLLSSDGKCFRADASTPMSSLDSPEHGCVWINICEAENGKSEDARTIWPEYALTICYADWTADWYERWLAAFLAMPEYREQFRVDLNKSGSVHPAIQVDLGDSGVVSIDEMIAPAIVELNRRGCRTTFCCQGVCANDEAPEPGFSPGTAYICMDASGRPFPIELFQAWFDAGFNVTPFTAYADAQYGLEAEASAHFVKSLQDWLAGDLDVTGQRYLVTGTRKSSVPAIPTVPENVSRAKQESAIRHLIQLGDKAKFSDYAALRSGVDKWSKVRLPALMVELGDRAHEVSRSGLDEEHKARFARWILRGLPFDMALRKIKVDIELTEASRKRRSTSAW